LWQNLKVVVLTNVSETQIANKVHSLGVLDVLAKAQLTPTEVVNNIHTLLTSVRIFYMDKNPEIIREQEKYNITDFASAKDFLFDRLMDSEKKLFGRELGVHRTEAWLKELGNPQEAFPSIHIAGTSGKGSTGYMISSILSALNQRVGTITSPHVYDIRERLLIDQHYITEEEFTHRTQNLITPIKKLEQSEFGRPTYFEAMIGLAHECFADHKVDYAVVETGIGGRFDSTNTIKRNDKLAVITRLGIDHTELLGSTPEEIAWQKAGIIPADGHAITLKPKDQESRKVIEQVARARNSILEFIDPGTLISNIRQTTDGVTFNYKSESLAIDDVIVPTLGTYQAENACLAIAIAEFLSKRDRISIDVNKVKRGLENIIIPARSEITDFHGTTVILDSAHNPQKLDAFLGLIESLKLPQKPLIIFATKKSKDWQSIIPKLISTTDEIFVTSFFSKQPGHLQKYSVNPSNIKHEIEAQGGTAQSFTTPIQALTAALSSVAPEQSIIVTGSMYMLGELHDHLQRLI